MMRTSLTVLVVLLPLLPAQGPTFVPKGHELVSFHADRVDELVARWPETRIGRLFADPDVAPAARACVDRVGAVLRRRNALRKVAGTLELELEPYIVSNAMRHGEEEMFRLVHRPVEELRAASVRFVAPVAEEGQRLASRQSMVVALHCGPRHQGRWARAFQDEVAMLQRSRFFDAEVGKLDGMPVHLFRPKPAVVEGQSLLAGYYDRWLLQLPGTFVYGPAKPEALGGIGVEPPAEQPGVRFRMHLASFCDMWRGMGRAVPRDFTGLGFEQLEWLEWTGRFVDDLILDEFAVKRTGELTGITKVVLGGAATPPDQALPKGAIAQLRGCLDVEALLRNLRFLDGPDLPEPVIEKAIAALDGGFAVACCAPPPGGLIPRVYVTLGVADEAAFAELLDLVVNEQDNLPLKQVTYDGVACTVLKLPDMPQGVQPAWCVHDGRLHVAESALSLRALLKAQRSGDAAMDVGDAPVPPGDGELLPNLELRMDEAQLYECFHERWLPLFELANAAGNARAPAIRRADLPDPEVFAEYCGTTRGVLRRDGDVYRLQILGALGGPELAAALMTFGPMLSQELDDYTTGRISRAIAHQQLGVAWKALAAFRAREQRWPKDLTELFAAERLSADALLVPGDEMAETFRLADGTEARTSFRYFADPIRLRATGADRPMLLVEVRPHAFNRTVLDVEGNTPEVFGHDVVRPVDELGKR